MLMITLYNGQRVKIGDTVLWVRAKGSRDGRGQLRVCIDAPKDLGILREDKTAFRERIEKGQLSIESKSVVFPLHSRPSKESVHTQHNQDHPKSE